VFRFGAILSSKNGSLQNRILHFAFNIIHCTCCSAVVLFLTSSTFGVSPPCHRCVPDLVPVPRTFSAFLRVHFGVQSPLVCHDLSTTKETI
jgi:hypothetical protein